MSTCGPLEHKRPHGLEMLPVKCAKAYCMVWRCSPCSHRTQRETARFGMRMPVANARSPSLSFGDYARNNLIATARFRRSALSSKKGQSKAVRSQTHAHSGLCAEEEIRTPTAVTPLPPQSSASTNFATSAGSANLL